jgi:hypothetical protein
MHFAIKFGLTNQKGIIDDQETSFINDIDINPLLNSPDWAESEEWKVLSSAIKRDTGSIHRAAIEVNIDPRLIVAQLVPEQLRLFHSNRELFKNYFAPLKVLGNQNQFSWGIMGIKKDTAVLIEQYSIDPTSPFYPGRKYEHLLDFKTNNPGQERFERITDEKDHYFAYIYVALYLREIIQQWQSSGYDIKDRPDILATLYNIGFTHSRPNDHPLSGGSSIEISGKTYSFGRLAGEFYYSDQLRDLFP